MNLTDAYSETWKRIVGSAKRPLRTHEANVWRSMAMQGFELDREDSKAFHKALTLSYMANDCDHEKTPSLIEAVTWHESLDMGTKMAIEIQNQKNGGTSK